jgi:hypothetical protein
LFCFSLDEFDAQCVGQLRHDLVLKIEQVGDVFVESVGPEMRAGFGVDKLGVDAHPVLIALHRAFEHVPHVELLADLLGVEVLALVGERSIARDHETVADARQVGGEVFGDSVGEIILGGIAGEVGEGQDHDREMLGLGRGGGVRGDGRGRVCRNRRGAACDEPIPPAGRNDEKQGRDPQQRRRWTLSWRGGPRRLRLGDPSQHADRGSFPYLGRLILEQTRALV